MLVQPEWAQKYDHATGDVRPKKKTQHLEWRVSTHIQLPGEGRQHQKRASRSRQRSSTWRIWSRATQSTPCSKTSCRILETFRSICIANSTNSTKTYRLGGLYLMNLKKNKRLSLRKASNTAKKTSAIQRNNLKKNKRLSPRKASNTAKKTSAIQRNSLFPCLPNLSSSTKSKGCKSSWLPTQLL